MSELADIIGSLQFRVAELERRLRSQNRTGNVEEADFVNGLVRVRLSTGMLTGWIPWEEQAAGANRTHVPPSIGQQVTLHSETGDLHDARVQTSLNSDANVRPSDRGDEYVLLSVGAASITVSHGGASLVITVGTSTLTMTAGAITAVSPRIDLN